jgi:hypothetical protein
MISLHNSVNVTEFGRRNAMCCFWTARSVFHKPTICAVSSRLICGFSDLLPICLYRDTDIHGNSLDPKHIVSINPLPSDRYDLDFDLPHPVGCDSGDRE